MGKKIINVFLILILAVQVLPVQQMGAAIFNNVFTEEIPHSLDIEKDAIKKVSGKSEFIDWSNPISPVVNTITQQQFYVDLSTWSGNGLYFLHIIDATGNIIDIKKMNSNIISKLSIYNYNRFLI